MFKFGNRITIICLTLLFFVPLPGFIGSSFALNRVTWEQLPYYLERQGIPLKNLSLCDCPVGLNPRVSSHQVVQVIGNTMYEWNEYEFSDETNRIQLAIQMLRPIKKRLSVAEARILLSASSGLLAQGYRIRGASFTMPIPEDPVAGLMRGVDNRYRTAVKTVDNRVKVDSNMMTELPYLTTAFLDIVFKGETFRGSGFLITPNCVLTAGHNVYWSDLTGNDNGYWADQITVIPDQYESDGGGVNLVMPYGRRTSEDLRTNTGFIDDTNELSEYDFGAIFIESPFSGIDTFMPLEFNSLPNVIYAIGYPGHPHGMSDSYDMWYATGQVLGVRGENNNIINYTASVSSGNSGGPIAYLNQATNEYRLVGIVTWEDEFYDSGVRFTNFDRDLIMSWWYEEPQEEIYVYKYDYYVPYYRSEGSVWSGVALTSPNESDNHIIVQYFSPQGDVAGIKSLSLTANGQKAFACAPESNYPTGWIKVSSTEPVYGLALVGATSPSTMFDMDLQSELHKKFLFPHLAADGQNWNSLAMLCNPNAETATVNLTYYPENGLNQVMRQVFVSAQGSVNADLKQLFAQNLNGGHIILQSDQPLVAFLLYDSSVYGKTNWKAGLSAVPIN